MQRPHTSRSVHSVRAFVALALAPACGKSSSSTASTGSGSSAAAGSASGATRELGTAFPAGSKRKVFTSCRLQQVDHKGFGKPLGW